MGQILHQSQETLHIIKRPGTSPFTDALHFISTIPSGFSCYLIECEYMNISFKYTWMNQLMQSQKIAVISCWNVEGALQSPICITWLLNMPSTVANTVLWTCSSTIRICSYTSDISSFDQYAAVAISLQMIFWSGNGVTSLTMLSFCSCKSKAVCSLPFFFGMQSIGTAWCATAGIHHCAVVYLSIFWESSSQKCSGHFGRW